MQRLHVQDLTGLWVDWGFHHLRLPAVAPRGTALIFPRSGRIKVREADEPLWPAREDAAQLEEQRRVLGSAAFSAQYQQEPVPPGGGLFPRNWWGYYDHLPLCDDWSSTVGSHLQRDRPK